MVNPVGMGIFGSFIQGQELENQRNARGLQNLAQAIGMGGALQSQQHQAQMNPLLLEAMRKRLNAPDPLLNVGAGSHLVDPKTGQPVFSAPFRPEAAPPPNPFSGIKVVPGGFITDAPGNPFTRTQREPAPPAPPAPSTTQIVDPTSPGRMLVIDTRVYKGGGLGSPGVIGEGGKTPEAAKKDETRTAGRNQISDVLDQLDVLYDNLDTMKGIPSTERGALENVWARAKASGVGQLAGGALGTQEQSVRNQIEALRPSLINAIRQSTGMSARQLDSNVELKFQLQSVTDTTKDIQANKAIIENLIKTYVKGGGEKSPAAPPLNQDEQAELEALRKKHGRR